MDSAKTLSELKETMSTAYWRELAPQLARDGLIVVSVQLDLLDVALSIAEDRTDNVKSWMAGGEIAKPSVDEIERWQSADPKFLCVIVKPFVLIQEAL